MSREVSLVRGSGIFPQYLLPYSSKRKKLILPRSVWVFVLGSCGEIKKAAEFPIALPFDRGCVSDALNVIEATSEDCKLYLTYFSMWHTSCICIDRVCILVFSPTQGIFKANWLARDLDTRGCTWLWNRTARVFRNSFSWALGRDLQIFPRRIALA